MSRFRELGLPPYHSRPDLKSPEEHLSFLRGLAHAKLTHAFRLFGLALKAEETGATYTELDCAPNGPSHDYTSLRMYMGEMGDSPSSAPPDARALAGGGGAGTKGGPAGAGAATASKAAGAASGSGDLSASSGAGIAPNACGPDLANILASSSFLFSLTDLHAAAVFDPPVLNANSPHTDVWEETIAAADAAWRRNFNPHEDNATSLPRACEAADRVIEVFDSVGLFEARVSRDLDDLHSGYIYRNYVDSIFHAPKPVLRPELGDKPALEFHIANIAYPRSFFENPELIANSFAYLAERAAHFGVDRVYTVTWLNSLPKWTKLFPKEWLENLGPAMPGAGPNLGCWGQMISSRQALNHRISTEFYRSGKLPYPMRLSWCSVDSLLQGPANL